MMIMDEPFQQHSFLLKLARFVIESNSSAFINCNIKAKTITIKSIDIFTTKILLKDLKAIGVEAFEEHMRAHHFFRVSSRVKIQSWITYKCTRIGMLEKCLRYAQIQKQIREATKTTASKLNSIKQNIEADIPIENVIESAFQMKSLNRKLKQLSHRLISQIESQNKEDLEDIKKEQERLLELSERDINISPLKTKTMEVIPTKYDDF